MSVFRHVWQSWPVSNISVISEYIHLQMIIIPQAINTYITRYDLHCNHNWINHNHSEGQNDIQAKSLAGYNLHQQTFIRYFISSIYERSSETSDCIRDYFIFRISNITVAFKNYVEKLSTGINIDGGGKMNSYSLASTLYRTWWWDMSSLKKMVPWCCPMEHRRCIVAKQWQYGCEDGP